MEHWEDITSTRSLILRQCVAADFAATRRLVRAAFGAVEPEETVAFLDALRDDGCVLGEWVAEDGRGILGHVVFSRVWLELQGGGRLNAVMLTPLAVRADRQREGVGTRLMQHALAELKADGERVFFVLGHPEYYPRVGFTSGEAAGIESPWPGEPAFMVLGEKVPPGRLVMPKVIADAH